MLRPIFEIFTVTAAACAVLTPFTIWLAPKIKAMDIPEDDRRMHTVPTPRFGGLAIFLSSIMAISLLVPHGADSPFSEKMTTGIVISGVIIFLLGAIDDIIGLSAKIKLFGQIVCAVILFYFDVKISQFTNPFTRESVELTFIVSFLITLVWIVGITNTINLIDGLDGLAAGVSLIATVAIAYIAYIHGRYEVCFSFMALAGSCLGFLPFNFHKAKTFMGDGGALYLGLMIAALSTIGPMKSYTVLATALPIFVLALPILDTLFAIIRRRRSGQPIMQADKGHLHHRIMNVGLGYRRTVLTLYCISGIMGVVAILISRDLFIDAVLLFGVAVTLIYVFMDDQKRSEEQK